MQSFIFFLCFVILLVDDVQSWRVRRKYTSEPPMSTTPTYNYNPAPNNNPMDSNGEAPRVPASANNSYTVPTDGNHPVNPINHYPPRGRTEETSKKPTPTPTYILDPVPINYNYPDSPATPIEQPHIEWLNEHQTYRDIKNY